MNYLAHAYLSFNDPEILVGNMISDFVKGKQKFDFNERVQDGIALHRAIDRFTDEHEATRQAKEFFKPAYRLYSGAFVDVTYDHFLATDEKEFTETSLMDFSQQTYHALDNYTGAFPLRFQNMLPYMKKQNWLFNYRTRWGTERSYEGLVRRAAYLTESKTAEGIFEQYYQQLSECYDNFFPELKSFAKNIYEKLRP